MRWSGWLTAPWPGNVRQLRNLVESMVVLAPGTEIRAADIPPDVLEGAGSLLPARVPPCEARDVFQARKSSSSYVACMDLRIQVEELRRRLDSGPQRVQVIEMGDRQPWRTCWGRSPGRSPGPCCTGLA